uniref:Structural polyprotein n=1 Tax=Bat dicistrovirus TaxID=1340808 RepID=A0A4P2T1D4_9VIRU|nr:structural polyprotein [Bat dicistrovirus]
MLGKFRVKITPYCYYNMRLGLFSLTSQDEPWQPHNIQGTPIVLGVLSRTPITKSRLATQNTESMQTGSKESYVASTSAEDAPQWTNMADQQQEITIFDDDKAIIHESMPLERPLPAAHTMQHSDAREHTVVSFLQRPQLLRRVEFNPSNTQGQLLFDVTVPDVHFTTMVMNKLDGFTSFRATAVFRLQVNAQPFQAGRLLMCAIPMPSLIAPRDQYILRHISLMQNVQHVQMDINKQSEVTLRVPFVSPFNSYDLVNRNYSWARISVAIYSPLNQAGGASLEALLWGYFEDVVLGAPTSAPIGTVAQQQAGEVGSRKRNQRVQGEIDETAVRKVEQRSSGQNLLKSVGDLASGNSFVGGILNTIGSWLGFSKPNDPANLISVAVRTAENFGNADGVDNGHVLALCRDNQVQVYPGLGGTDADETSLEYVTRFPQYIDGFLYTNTATSGQELWRTLVMPTYYLPADFSLVTPTFSVPAQGVGGNAISQQQPTTLHYAVSPFMYWHGDLVYTIRFVKTDFHSGRVEISYHPFTATVDSSRMEYVYRLIVDLRDQSEVSFTIPFISSTPWKVVSDLNPLVQSDWVTAGPSATGVLYVRALTPLIIASAVAGTTVEALVEVRAGKNFAVQGPNRSYWYPCSLLPADSPQFVVPPGYEPTSQVRVISVDDQIVAQEQAGNVHALPGTAETRTAAVEGFQAPSITGNPGDLTSDDTQPFCAGEMFGNYRSLTRRFAFVDTINMRDEFYWAVRPHFYIRPPTLTWQLVELDGGGTVSERYVYTVFGQRAMPTALSWVASMYTFYRGSVRAKAFIPTNTLMAARLNFAPMLQPLQDVGRRTVYPFMSPTGYELIEKRIGEWMVPYYSPTLVSTHWDMTNLNPFDQPLGTLELSADYTTTSDNSTFAGSTARLAVAAGDDMTFHSFLGPPLCISSSEWNAVGPTTYASGTSVSPIAPSNVFDKWDLGKQRVDPTYETASNLPPDQSGSEPNALYQQEIQMGIEHLVVTPRLPHAPAF